MRGSSFFHGNGRLVIGGHVLVPVGKPVHIGPHGTSKGLARVTELGASKTITLIVGQTKGKQAKNRKGPCARKPGRFTPAAVDRVFAEVRTNLIGRGQLAATRRAGKGWYEGGPENSVAYDIAFIPNAREKTFGQFKKNMDRLAEELAERFCQDSVLLLRDDGKRRTVASAEWDEPEKTKRRK